MRLERAPDNLPRPRAADNLTDPNVKHGVCIACDRRGLISKTTKKCVGTWQDRNGKVHGRFESCLRKASKKRQKQEAPGKVGPE